jgi:hypothetical protein
MKTIETKCGIYDTEYTLIKHRDGSISIKTPYVKWVNNSGSLAFKNVKITRFIGQALANFSGSLTDMTMSEIVYENDQ